MIIEIVTLMAVSLGGQIIRSKTVLRIAYIDGKAYDVDKRTI